MEIINRNIRHLRKQAVWTQKELAEKLNINFSSIGAYEEFRSIPPIPIAIKIADLFKIDLDTLIRIDLEKTKKKNPVTDKFKKKKDVLAITVDSQNKENVEFVNQKASAGYLTGYNDPEFVQDLPKINLPFLSRNNTYRAFEIIGDSMLPIPSKSIVIGEYLNDLSQIKNGEVYVIITKEEGIVYKMAYNFLKESNGILLVFDNPLFSPYFINFNDIIEVWKKIRIILDTVESNTMISGNDIASFSLTIHNELLKILI